MAALRPPPNDRLPPSGREARPWRFTERACSAGPSQPAPDTEGPHAPKGIRSMKLDATPGACSLAGTHMNVIPRWSPMQELGPPDPLPAILDRWRPATSPAAQTAGLRVSGL